MSLFAILGMPCLAVFLLLTDGRTAAGGMALSPHDAPDRAVPILEFIKGFFYAVPCVVVVLLVRRYIPLSYRSFSLYLLFLFTDHLIPVVFLGVFFFLVYARKGYRSLLSFGGGFYTLMGIINIFAQYGRLESYHLFLLPVTRMAALLFLVIFFLRFQEWYGLIRVLFLVLMISVPFVSGTVTYFYMKAYLLWAVVVAVLFFLGSLFYTYIERKI